MPERLRWKCVGDGIYRGGCVGMPIIFRSHRPHEGFWAWCVFPNPERSDLSGVATGFQSAKRAAEKALREINHGS